MSGSLESPLLTNKPGSRPSPVKVHAALILVQCCFSGWHLVGKFALSSCKVNPLIFALYREVVSSALLFGAAALLEGVRTPRRAHAAQFVFLGSLYFGNVVGMLTGLSLTSATNAAMMQPLCPLFVWLLSVCVGTEAPTLWRGLGVIVATAGGLAVAGGAIRAAAFSASGDTNAAILGNIILLGQVACIAGTVVLQKSLLQHYAPVNLTAWGYGIGACITTLASLQYVNRDVWRLTQSAAIWSLAYSVVFATCVTYTLMCREEAQARVRQMSCPCRASASPSHQSAARASHVSRTWANKHTQSSTVGVYQLLAPLLTAIASSLFFGAPPTWLMGAGGVLIVAGLLVSFCSGAAPRPKVER